MTKFLSLIALFSLFATTAFAADYGICANSIADEAGALIAPVVPAQKTMVVTDEVAVIVVQDSKDPEMGDSVASVIKKYETELYAALRGKPKGVWVGVIEGIDGNENPSLWLYGWVATSNGCVRGTILERIYAERANAPTVFWKEVQDWEDAHPEVDHLIHSH